MSEELRHHGACFPVYAKALSLLVSVGSKVPDWAGKVPGWAGKVPGLGKHAAVTGWSWENRSCWFWKNMLKLSQC